MILTEILRAVSFQDNIYIFLTTVALGFVIVWYRFRNRNLPPGPYGIPYIGYFPFLGEDYHLELGKLSKKYGDIMSFTTFGKTCIHLNNLDLVKEAFLDRAEDFSGREPAFNIINFIDDGKGITATEGTIWKEQRHFFLQTVKRFGYGKISLQGHIHEVISEFLEKIKESKGKPIDFYITLSNSTCNVICKVLMEKRFAYGRKDFEDLSRGIQRVLQNFLGSKVFYVGPLVELLFPFLSGGNDLKKAKKYIHGIVRKMIEEHVETYDPTNIRDFTDCYLEELDKIKTRKSESKTSFSMDSLQANNVNLLIEGTESVSYTIYRMIRELVKHPEVQSRIQKELDEVVGSERLPSWADRTNMPYTEATICELQRLAIPFPLSAFHSNANETTFHGYRIPKRSLIISNLWSIHQDPKLWPEPQKFDPKRHLNSYGKCVKGEGLLMFGLGKRSCPGESLAVMEIFLFITSLLQKFTIKDAGANDPSNIHYRICAVPREH